MHLMCASVMQRGWGGEAAKRKPYPSHEYDARLNQQRSVEIPAAFGEPRLGASAASERLLECSARALLYRLRRSIRGPPGEQGCDLATHAPKGPPGEGDVHVREDGPPFR
ncbi:unnamed protein product [Prorocentrum cordatum]|uniref:Uncharacterized protein n=1 Tax=Prorocentrum cordatum TaxID=2364126 RepID=A0ABN9Y8T0_9DINO|nr:unnamed protein product [Polarella glacialis]